MPTLTGLLCDLVAIPSVNPSGGDLDPSVHGEGRVVGYVADLLSREGIPWVRQEVLPGRPNLVARLEGTTGRLLILEAHTDTVTVEGMAGDPFAPEVRDGRVWGRGACDCKASLAAMVTALVRTARRGRPPCTVVLAATCDEEYLFRGIRALISRPREAGLEPGQLATAMGCVGEPTGLQVVIAHKGALRCQLRTRGVAAHSSEPGKGRNAIYPMGRLLGRLEAHAAELAARAGHPLVGPPTLNVGRVSGGVAVNIVPDACEALVDRRLLPGEGPQEALAELRGALGEDEEWELETLLEDEALETAAEAEVVSLARDAVTGTLGQCAVAGVQYGTDASKLARAGVQSVVCGPGQIAQAHTTEEWVEVAQLEAAARVYEAMMAHEPWPAGGGRG
jgi:acetylornithine deacetylase/succinyl-diaminopimelate desuccinylase-like protein